MKESAASRTSVSRSRRSQSSTGGVASTAVRTPKSATRHPASEIILLSVTGMSPAVLTETVWALAREADPVLPSRVIAVTTALGRQEIERQLFQPLPRFGGQTVWHSLREQLAARGLEVAARLRFGTTSDDIRVITGVEAEAQRSRELQDIRTPADNEAAADFLLEQVRTIVENPDTQLIASIAGGRKTMGALLYACLTLAGRETDRLTHVLVSEPYETLREFYFPSQPGGPIVRPEIGNQQSGPSFDPAAAVVELADVPFVALRNLFQRELGRKAGTFSRLVETCRENVRQRAAEGLRVSIDTARLELEVNGQVVKLAPLEHLLLIFLARRAKHGEPAYGSYDLGVDDLNAFRTDFVSRAPKDDFSDWRHADSLRAAWDEQEIRKAVSGIRAKLRQRGGDAAALASCLPEKGRCSLDIPGPLIHLKG